MFADGKVNIYYSSSSFPLLQDASELLQKVTLDAMLDIIIIIIISSSSSSSSIFNVA